MRFPLIYEDGRFNITCRLTEDPDPRDFHMHTHSRAELYCFQQGKGIFHIEGAEYVLQAGDILVIGPSESHYMELDCTQPYARCYAHFPMELFRSIDPEGLLLKPFTDRKPGTLNLYRAEEFQDGTDPYWALISAAEGDPRLNAMTGMLSLLHDIYGIYCSRKQEPPIVNESLAYRIIRYVNKHLSEPLCLDDICRRFFISKSQLCRLFKKATGTTIWQYVTVKRLVQARLLMGQGEKPTHVYALCGFNDYSSFYRAYVKHYGHGPNQE